MMDFNYNNWLRQTKAGPYQRSILTESENQMFKVIGKSKNHLVAYPDPQGGYTRSELESWYQKGYELSQSRQVEFATSKEDAENLSGENIDEDTYTQTYDQGGPENPQPDEEQFQESSGIEDTNTAIEYYADAEVTGFDNSQMPPRYADTKENTLATGIDLESDIEDKVMTLFPKYFRDVKVTPYQKFSYDPDIETSQEPVIVKYGYNGWEPLPQDLLGYLSSKYNIKQRYGYDTEEVQYIIYPK